MDATDTDRQALRDLRYELEHEPELDHAAVHALVHDGIAILQGRVVSCAAKTAAAAVARKTTGIRGVFDNVTVEPDPDATDAAVLARVRTMLDLDGNVPDTALDVAVHNGHVTLAGTVRADHQREAARRAAARVRGVTGVTVRIMVDTAPSLSEVRGRLAIALQRAGEAAASMIDVEIDGTAVTISGRVPRSLLREAALGAVRTIPGVESVEAQLEFL